SRNIRGYLRVLKPKVRDWSANEEDDESDGVQNCKQLKESMIDYGVSNGYQLVFPVNDYRRLLVRCGKEEIDYEDDSMGKNDEKEDSGVDNNGDQDGMGINNEIEKDSVENNDEHDGVGENDEKAEDGVETRNKQDEG
ncbi:hypothetical protein Tco_1411241, partial [Tanacetum coccineum]